MIIFFKHFLRFVILILVQSLIFNQLELGFGIQFMIYPLFILLLPHDISVFINLIVAFLLGILIDMLSNTYGLHASSAVFLALIRGRIFKLFEQRDAYEVGAELSIQNMGFQWVLYVQGSLLLLHHFWFFLMEIFRIDELFFILQKTILSVISSFILLVLIQMIFIKKSRLR
jgi:hypothetical protein